MRILIIGEFSSFSKNLSAGFRALGHDCFVFSWGDGFKKIKAEGEGYSVPVPHERKLPFPFGGIVYRLECFYNYLKLKSYVKRKFSSENWDVVFLINPDFIKNKWFQAAFSKKMILGIVRNPANIFLSACGGDISYVSYWMSQNWKNKQHVINLSAGYLSQDSENFFNYYSSFIDKVIPVMYDYAEAWRNSKYAKSFSVLPTIPLPVDTSKYIPYNELKQKIVVFHGIIRPKAKGTHYIVEAMNQLQEKYPDKVECVAKGGMPLDEYLSLLKRANILIDQTYAGSSGMNALYALAMGKVLLGGNEPENSIEYKCPNIPIINICADIKQIYEELEKLVLHPERILQLAKEGREYVEKIHDSKIVAQQYVDTFQKYGKGLG